MSDQLDEVGTGPGPVGAGWATIGTDRYACNTVKQLPDASLLQMVTSADVLAKYEGPIRETYRQIDTI